LLISAIFSNQSAWASGHAQTVPTAPPPTVETPTDIPTTRPTKIVFPTQATEGTPEEEEEPSKIPKETKPSATLTNTPIINIDATDTPIITPTASQTNQMTNNSGVNETPTEMPTETATHTPTHFAAEDTQEPYPVEAPLDFIDAMTPTDPNVTESDPPISTRDLNRVFYPIIGAGLVVGAVYLIFKSGRKESDQTPDQS